MKTNVQGNNNLIVWGCRVINVIGINKNLKAAINYAYNLAEKINFDNKYYRRDIGVKAVSYTHLRAHET